MFRQAAIGGVVLLVLGAGIGYGAWVVPAVHPDEARLIEADKTAKRSAAYLEYDEASQSHPCSAKPDAAEKAACEAERKAYPVNEDLVYMLVPQAIPDADCALMARVLKDKTKVEDDAEIVLNYEGRFNCDFSKYGIAHYVGGEPEGGYVIEAPAPTFPYEHRQTRVSKEAYAFAYRNVYVTRPVYSLFGTRMNIEYGSMQESGSGWVCFYNRFMGDWRLEGECQMVWVS